MPADASKSDVLLALVASLSSATATLWAAAATGSAALFATGVLFLASGSSQALMLLGLSGTQRSAPGKQNADLYVWSFVAALILFSLGAGVAVYEGIGKITDASRILLRANNAYAALAVAFTLTVAAHVGALAAATTAARTTAAAPVFITTRIETIAALAGLVIAGLGVSLSYAWDSRFADGAAAILVGLVIGTVATVIGVEIRRLLIRDTRPSEATVSTDATQADAPKDDAEKEHSEVEQAVPEREAIHETSPAPTHTMSEKEKAPPRLSRRAKKRREQQQRRHSQQGSDT